MSFNSREEKIPRRQNRRGDAYHEKEGHVVSLAARDYQMRRH